MSEPALAKSALHHHVRRMSGRDPHEAHRVSTPLELLFDLTFVLSFGFAAAQYAHALAAGHYGVAFAGFALASFAICWAWINFTWFSSAISTKARSRCGSSTMRIRGRIRGRHGF